MTGNVEQSTRRQEIDDAGRAVLPAADEVVMQASALSDAEVPTRVLIAPWGEVRSSAGSFILDDEAALATIAAFEAHGTDLPVDYEHQTLGGAYSSPSGEAPAAGWIKALSVISPAQAAESDPPCEPGLWADVGWTSEALEKLRARKYRYLSPVALVRRSDRRVVGIHSVALTNKPAIVGMRPVVNQSPPIGSAGGESMSASLRGILALGEDTSDEVLLVAAAQRIRTLEEAEKDKQASERVSCAMAAGKLTEAQRDWALSLARRDLRTFDEWEASAPALVPLGRLSPPDVSASVAPAGQRAAEESARAEWRAHREFLEKFCSESAYVANALRERSA